MSLMGTLAKVAIGVALAKGAGSLMQRGGSNTTGGLFGSTSATGAQSGGGLESMLGSLLGGGGQQGGGLGGLMQKLGGGGGLDELIGGLTGGSGQGGLGGLLGGLTGGGGSGGGLGGLLGGLAGASSGASAGGSFGDILNQSFARGGEPETAPSPQQDATAGLMLRAIIQAAKSDGNIDADEQKKLLGNLGDATPEEMDFVRAELAAPVDVKGLADQVPRGMVQQVYSMSVMGITLDNQKEAQYLADLATALGLEKRDVNTIHEHLGVPLLYA